MKLRRRQLSCLVATVLVIAAMAGELPSAGRLDSPGHEDGTSTEVLPREVARLDTEAPGGGAYIGNFQPYVRVR